MDFDPEPLDPDQDFNGSKSTPDLVYGDGGWVYWKNCPSVTLAKSNENKGQRIHRDSGKARLAKGLKLVFVGDGGQFKQD
ncbi:hypothetical protein HYQ46_012883 [Verticillium longisporum]|nr:hypothetical protein HYQ44_008544 [Verticillium longisporum]KAG7151343.1 hypothetical protein HYQ46_012883 [Verticillium longisporum]